MNAYERDRTLARLNALNDTFIKGRIISYKQEMIWSFVNQVFGGQDLSDKQKKLLGEWEYLEDTNGKGWEFNRGKGKGGE